MRYNPAIPIETFDVIVTDECHRSIYNLWRGVLEYFDAFIVGLTATPNKATFGFFRGNLVMEYGHDRAVADGVNVDYEVYRIRTAITEHGSTIEKGEWVDRRDKQTRAVRWEQLDEDLGYRGSRSGPGGGRLGPDTDGAARLQRCSCPSSSQAAPRCPRPSSSPRMTVMPRTLSRRCVIVFGRGNEFCQKITYRTTGAKPEDLIHSFRNSFYPRIAVTVDMIATGTDIRPLEVLLFMRMVKSQGFFEQMKGRGTRTISDTDFQSVTTDARSKTHFVLVDAVGVCEQFKTDDPPLERKRSVSFAKLLEAVALGIHDDDTLSSLAGRLGRLATRVTARGGSGYHRGSRWAEHPGPGPGADSSTRP